MADVNIEPDDISWRTGNQVFKYRVAAIITHNDHLLVCGTDDLDHQFLPGGKVRFGESTHEALDRELTEEVGHPLPSGELTAITENIYSDDGILHHELGFYYRIGWPTHLDPDINGGAEDHQHLGWMPVEQLADVPFQPADLLPAIQRPPSVLQHLVFNRQP